MTQKTYLRLSLLIFILALFLRFYRLSGRFGFHYDQARDALVGYQAVKLGKIPLNGPFTSAGPFVFGPFFYYLIMCAYFILPYTLMAPQIMLSLLNALFPLVMIKIGELVFSKKTGLIMGLLAALSFINIERAHILHPHNFITFFTALMLLNFVYFYKTKKIKHLFFFGFNLACALSIHYQALNLFLYIPFIFFANKLKVKKILKPILTQILVFSCGFLIPSLPLIIWDYQRGWKNIANILDYFLIGQYRIWVSNRWLLYVGKFWPDFWAQIIGGHIVFGYLFIILSVAFSAFLFWKKKLSRTTLALALIFFLQVVLLRYYRGEKNFMYLLYLVPLVIFFSGFVVNKIFLLNRFLGLIFLLLVAGFALKSDLKLINTQANSYRLINNLAQELETKMPQEKFRLYVWENNEPAIGTMTSIIFAFKNLCDEQEGTKLGFSVNKMAYQELTQVQGAGPSVYVYKLESDFPVTQTNNILLIGEENWFEVSPGYVYNDVVEWWKVKEFNSYFSLKKYLQTKFFGEKN